MASGWVSHRDFAGHTLALVASEPHLLPITMVKSRTHDLRLQHYSVSGETFVAWALSAACIFVTVSLVPGFVVGDFTQACFAAAALSLVNCLGRPMLQSFFTPLTSVTYASYMFLLNAALFASIGVLTPAFYAVGPLPAILASVVLTTLSTGLDSLTHQPLAF